SAEVPAPLTMKTRFFSCATFDMARAVPELVPPNSIVRLSVSIHSRAFDVGIEARHVGDETDLDLLLGLHGAGGKRNGKGNGGECNRLFHIQLRLVRRRFRWGRALFPEGALGVGLCGEDLLT